MDSIKDKLYLVSLKYLIFGLPPELIIELLQIEQRKAFKNLKTFRPTFKSFFFKLAKKKLYPIGFLALKGLENRCETVTVFQRRCETIFCVFKVFDY